MKIGDKIRIKGNEAELIEIKDNYGLFKFDFGKFVFNIQLIREHEKSRTNKKPQAFRINDCFGR